jgi:hypothetical protein
MRSLRAPALTSLLGVAVCWLGLGGIVHAATPAAERVELFAASRAGQLELKVVPKDASQATVVIRNKTDRPLSIQLPAAFVGMPVLAQDGGNNRGNRGGNNSSSTSSNQSFGGGMMGGMGGGFGGGMGGFMDVGPERVAKIKVATVCLEHGKDDPNPRVAYELKPIEAFTDKAELIEVCKMLGLGELDQVSAQAAAWHLSDGLSWQELARKVRVQHLNGRVEMYFYPQQLTMARRAVQMAHHRAAASSVASVGEAQSPGEQAEAEARPRPLRAAAR